MIPDVLVDDVFSNQSPVHHNQTLLKDQLADRSNFYESVKKKREVLATMEENQNKKKKMILLIVLIVILLAAGITALVLLLGRSPDQEVGPSGSGDTTSSISSDTSSNTELGDVDGEPELPGEEDNYSSTPNYNGNNGGTSSKPSGTTSKPETTSSERDNSVGSQPTPPAQNYGGNDGFTNSLKVKRDVFTYDDFRYFTTPLSNFAELLKNAKELMMEPFMFNKADNPLADDYQQTVTQTGQYVFQHVGVSCKNPMETYFAKYQGNPIAWGQNVYTPWMVKKEDTWYVYYGGWGTVDCTGNDTSYLMTTKDPDLRGPYTQHGVVMKADGANYVHAQDPSVALGPDGKFYMAYTQTKIAYGKGVDWIGMARSDDGIHFTAYGSDKVGIADSPDSEIKFTNYERNNDRVNGYDNIGRPSLYYNEDYVRADGKKGRWEMYVDGEHFDGKGTSNAMQIFFFTSEEDYPINWKYEGAVRQGGETALAVIDGVYYLAYRDDSSWPSRMKVASSTDGLHYGDGKLIITGERTRDGSVNNITQMAFAVDNNEIKAIMYGRSVDGWQHKVSLAYPQKRVEVFRGGEWVTAESLAASSTTQVISSGGIYTPVTKLRVYDTPGQPAAFEAFVKLYSGQSQSLVKNDVAPAKPVLLGPDNGETKVLWGPTFMWSPTYKASSYKLEIATDANFKNIVLAKDKIVIESYKIRDSLQLGQTYYWRVTAKNSTGSTVSNVQSFTVCKENEVRGELIQVLPDKVTASDDADSGSNINNLSDGPYYTHWTAAFDEDAPPSFTENAFFPPWKAPRSSKVTWMLWSK